MAQYCRYCQNFVTGNGNYCEVKRTEPTDAQAKRVNHCKQFELNPMDAFMDNEKGYQPRAPRETVGEQMKMDFF